MSNNKSNVYQKPKQPTYKPPQKKKSKFTLSQWITFILMIFWTLTSILSIVTFVKDVSADTEDNTSSYSIELMSSNTVTYQYNGSQLFIPFTNVNDFQFTYFFLCSFHFNVIGNNLIVGLDSLSVPATLVHLPNGANETGSITYYTFNHAYNKDTQAYLGNVTNISIPRGTWTPVLFTQSQNYIVNRFSPYVVFTVSSGFTPNIQSINLGFKTGTDNFNFIEYVDTNLNTCRISFYLLSNTNNQHLRFTNSTYFLSNSLGDEYQVGFHNGSLAGNNEGYKKGLEIGLEQGFDSGYDEGKSDGYNEGILDANDYSFLGLVGSVVDAPITAVSGLLNFDLLGFNMANFFFAIITLCLIIAVIRLVL